MTFPALPAHGQPWDVWGAAVQTKLTATPPTINVKDYGAVGDGTTNDTTAIQAALSAVPNAGATVFFPAGLYLVPNGGLTCTKPVRLLGTSGSYYAGVGSAIQVTADSVIGLTLSGQASHLSNFGVFHPTTGTRSAGLIGVKFTASVFNRVENCHFSGFSTNVAIDNGYYWSITDTLFEDFAATGLDIRNTASPDSGDCTVSGCTFFRNGSGTAAGHAVVWHSSGGLRFVNNKVNGGGFPFVDCLRLLTDDGVATSVLVVGDNSFENYTGAGLSLNVAGTTGLFNNSVMVTGNEFNAFNTTSGVGVQIDMAVIGVTITGNHFYHLNTGIDLQRVRHASVSGNSLTDIRTTGIRVRDSALNVMIPKHPIDMIAGGVAVQFDQPKLVTDPTAEATILFGTWSDTVVHDLFEIGMVDYTSAILDVDITGVNEGVGMFVRRFSRALVSGAIGTDATTVTTIGTDHTTTGAITVTMTGAGMTGPVKVSVQKAAGTAFTGQINVRVRGASYFKQLIRTA